MAAGRPRSSSPVWSSSVEDDDDEDDFVFQQWGPGNVEDMPPPRPATAGSLGTRARTPQSGTTFRTGNAGSRPPTPFIAPCPMPKMKILKERDMESLYDEIMQLSQAIHDRNGLIKKQKVYASKLRLQNRKLEKNVDSLEKLGIKGPRTGAPTRLRAIVQGLRLKMAKYEALCASQEDEIYQLERDLRVTNSKEIQIERDVFAGELGRLQQVIKHLKKSQERLNKENKEINYMKDKNKILEQANERLQFTIEALHGSVTKANEDMDASREAAKSASEEAKEMNRLYDRIMEHKTHLERLVDMEKMGKEKVEKRMMTLSAMITRTEKQLLELARKGVPIPGLKLRGGAADDPYLTTIQAVYRRRGDDPRFIHVGIRPDVTQVAVDQCCQTSSHSRNPATSTSTSVRRCRSASPVVPRLDLARLTTPDGHERREKAHAVVPTVPEVSEVASKSSKSSKSSKNSKSSKTMKKKKKARTPSPDPYTRPPSRLAFVPEALPPVDLVETSPVVASAAPAAVAPPEVPAATVETSPDAAARTPPAAAAAGTVSAVAVAVAAVAVAPSAAEQEQEVPRLIESRKLETVSEEVEVAVVHDKRPPSGLGERRHHLKSAETTTSSSSYVSSLGRQKKPGTQRMQEVRSRRDRECLEWLRTLELPEDSRATTSSAHPPPPRPSTAKKDLPPQPPRSRSAPTKPDAVYAEDTLQMTQLSRPAFDFTSKPGNRCVWRQQHPP